jgi:hypothetical protein
LVSEKAALVLEMDHRDGERKTSAEDEQRQRSLSVIGKQKPFDTLGAERLSACRHLHK